MIPWQYGLPIVFLCGAGFSCIMGGVIIACQTNDINKFQQRVLLMAFVSGVFSVLMMLGVRMCLLGLL